VVGVVILLAVFLFPAAQQPSGLEIVASNLDTVWGIDFLPDDRMIFTERNGRLNILDGQVTVIAELEVSEVAESGLLGIAVDPEFSENNYIYLYYTRADAQLNRLSRFTLGKTITDEFVLLDNIPSAKFHDGGRIKFGPDGLLYITVGDATTPATAQDLNSLAGKLLRMNKDGSIPSDNPFNNYVYSYGHRNAQGLDWINGKLFASEHGNIGNDELNIIESGGNYGWPLVECTQLGVHTDAVRCYSDFTLAPSSIAFYNGDLYIAGLRSTQLRKLTFNEDYSEVVSEEAFVTDVGRIREVVAHNGYLYFSTSNLDGRWIPNPGDDKIFKVKLL